MPSIRVLRPRPFIVAIGAIAGWATLATGQVSPDGRHHTTVGPGTGVAQHGSPTGGFAASVPLDLPDPRGPLPVPVSIVYTGTSRAGAAGVGWDVPVTFVRRQVSTWRRRPKGAVLSDQGPERIQLGLGGATQLMVPRTDGVYVPYAGSEYLELRRSGTGWKLRTLDNLEYTFSPSDQDLWLATEIRDLVGTDRVELRYTSWGDLASVSHTYGLDEKLPLYEVKLVHEEYDGTVFDSVVDDARRFSRSRVIKRVEVWARNNHAPSLEPKIIRAYHLTYEGDLDTGKPRLKAVRVSGEEGAPGGTLPVAEYGYGSISSPDKPGIHFGPEEIVARNLPAAFQYHLSTTSTEVEEFVGSSGFPPTEPPRGRREWSRTRHLLRDFTGDGLPDLLYKEGNLWKLVANRLDSSGNPQLDGPVTSQWTEPAELHVETTFRFVPPYTTQEENRSARQAMITTDTWTTFVDWNGDGRLDIVDTRAGAHSVAPEDSWRIWINEPTANGGIQWRPFDLRVGNLRGFLDEHGFQPDRVSSPFFSEVSDHLPLARTRSWPRVNTWDCRSWACTTLNGFHCDPAQPCEDAPDWYDPDAPVQVDTMTEWELADSNGDSYPDFVALTRPVRQCERRYEYAGGPDPGLSGSRTWGWNHCESGDSPLEVLGLDLQEGTYACAAEQHEWISSEVPFPGDPAINWPCGEAEPGEAGAVVFLNRFGPFLGHASSALGPTPIELDGEFPSGLGQWTTGSVTLGSVPRPAAGVSWQAGGLLDRFGSGELKPVTRTNLDTHVDTAIFNNNREENCRPGSLATIFESWQKAGEADLNGDGLADHLFASSNEVATARWRVRFNTGVGFTEPADINAPVRFAVSEARGSCSSTDMQSAAGLTDLDGDGIPELLRVSGGLLRRSKLAANSLEVGRLTRIHNGYGAITYIHYANAKADTTTRHAVPFAEIVVSETGTRVQDGGPGIAPVFYAYGDASLTYEPFAGGWAFSGYRRTVAMTGILDEQGAYDGVAVITDRTAPAAPGSTWSTHATAQQVSRTRLVEGAFYRNDLPSLLVGDPPAFAETQTEYAAKQLLPSTGGIPNLDCADLDPIYGIAAGSYRCGSAGLVYATTSQAWEGVAAPPTLVNTQAGSSTNEVDDFGRPTSLTSFGDLRRTDDDVCTSIEYATPPGGGAFPSVPSTMTVTDCGWGNPVRGKPGVPRTLSAVRFYYDEQPHGVVQRGRLTSRQVDRYGPTGYLDTQTVARTKYDDLGEIATITNERTIGGQTTHTIQFKRDAFGSTVTSMEERASDVATAFTGTSQIYSWPTIPSRLVDQHGVAANTQHDRFGRKVLSWVDTGTRKSVLSRVIYGDDETGRSVTVETFPGDVLPGSELTTTDKQRSTAQIDSLGRVRFTVHELGADYAGARIIGDVATFDALGRVTFVAAPFETSENPFVPNPLAEPFGTTVVYDRRGRVVREISANGYQPETYETVVDADVFVRSFGYHYENGQLITTAIGADENDASSDNHLALDVVYRTALGREIRRARHAPGGERIDLVEQEWDRLGRVDRLRRYLQPEVAAGPITWSSEFDSLGRQLSISEPGTSTRYSSYDEDGNEIMSWWQDGVRRRVSAAMYDGFGRVRHRRLSSIENGVETDETSEKFFYDQHSGRAEQPQGELRGRLSWAETAGVGAVFFGYDALGRTSSTSYLYEGHGQLVREATSQALGGRLRSLELTTPLGTDLIDYEYDSAERMRRVRRGNSVLASAEFDAKGRPQRVDYGNGARERFDYAQLGREELLRWSAPGYGNEYLEFDGAGRLRFERVKTENGETLFGYQHDALGRISTVARSTGGFPEVERYTHDPLGNMLTRTGTGLVNLTYQRDAADPDRMCRIASGSGSCNMSYDGAGNVVRDKLPGSGGYERRFHYDAGQRITNISRGKNEVGLLYGPVGRARTGVKTPTSQRTHWHFGLIEERWLSGGVVQVERKVPGPLGVTMSLRTEQVNGGSPTETVIYAHGDGRGNRVFTGDDGAIVQSATYGTYGQTTTTGSGGAITQTDDLWNGGDNLPEVGVVLLGPRAYDPSIGRFLQRDPIRVALRASTANPYAFAFSNPVDFADPTGLTPEGGGGGGGGGGSTSTGGKVGTVAFTAIAYLTGLHRRSPLNPQNAVGADGYTGTALLNHIRSRQTLCTGACELGRDAYSAVDTAYDVYGDYLLGKGEALLDTAGEIGDMAIANAKCSAALVYCVGKKVVTAPKKAKQAVDTVRASPALATALYQKMTTDPFGWFCDGDGCSAREIGRIEVKTKIAVATTVTGGGGSGVGAAGRGIAAALKALRRRVAGGGLPELRISASQYPELAENILHAQRAGHPDVLTHGGNAAANRNAALDSIPNIRGFSRDEYPFASSIEGGKGSWVGHIPAWQQSAQGGLISSFVQAMGIQPGMQYRVVVVP